MTYEEYSTKLAAYNKAMSIKKSLEMSGLSGNAQNGRGFGDNNAQGGGGHRNAQNCCALSIHPLLCMNDQG